MSDDLQNWIDFRRGEIVTKPSPKPCCECGKESSGYASFDDLRDGKIDWICKTCCDNDVASGICK